MKYQENNMDKITVLTGIYKGILKKILYIISASILTLLFSFIIVFPVWYFSDKSPSGFSITAVLIIILFTLYSFILKIKKHRITLKIAGKILLNISAVLIFIFSTAIAVVLIMNSLVIQGIVVLVFLFLALGLIRYFNISRNE
jgi:MFS superfamily sulfate permease-like transporter